METCCRHADLRECACCGKTFRTTETNANERARCCPECGDSHTRSLDAKRRPRRKRIVAAEPPR